MEEWGCSITLTLGAGSAGHQRPVCITESVIAGWAARDQAAQRRHIKELEEIGVKPPSRTPVYYRVAAARFAPLSKIEIPGENSSGEAEVAMLQADGKLWIGVGSDHTDRKVEAYDITVSKQLCDKPIASLFWSFESVAGHWDALILRSFIFERGQRVLYQEGAVSGLLAPMELIAGWQGQKALPEGTIMLGGTLPAIGGIRPSNRFEFELEDPVLHRKIQHAYDIVSLPIAS